MKDLQHGSKREAASSQNFICLMTVQPSAQTGENEPDALLLFTIQWLSFRSFTWLYATK